MRMSTFNMDVISVIQTDWAPELGLDCGTEDGKSIIERTLKKDALDAYMVFTEVVIL